MAIILKIVGVVALTALLKVGVLVEAYVSSEGLDIVKELVNKSDPHITPLEAVEVRIGIYVNSMHVNLKPPSMSMTLYFRQAWKDPRLTFQDDNLWEVRIPPQFMDQFWMPDTFMRHSVSTENHETMTPNVLMKVNKTGHVWHVSKLTLTTACYMSMSRFPFASESCGLHIESYGHTTDTLYYSWLDSPVNVDHSLILHGFSLEEKVLYNCTQNYTAGTFPCLEVRFMLKTDYDHYIMKLFLPSIALVTASFLVFWFDPNLTRDKLTLLMGSMISCMLVVVANPRPDVTAHTAMDTWVLICLLFLVAAILETMLAYCIQGGAQKTGEQPIEMQEASEGDRAALTYTYARSCWGRARSKLDVACRAIFPLTFLIFNIIYWSLYTA